MKLNKKYIKRYLFIIFGIIFVMLNLMPVAFADAGDFISKQFAKLIRSVGMEINQSLTDAGAGIDKLIFNQGSKDLGLTLLSGGDLAKYIFKIYHNMQYIGAALMIPIGLWITLDFIKFSTDAKHKAVLIDRLKNFTIGILLLMSMPLFLDIIIKVNAAVVDIFRELGLSAFGNGDMKDGLLMDMFKKTVQDDKTLTIMGATVFTISSFLNGYFLILYFVRDLAITFLFLLFPIIVMNFAYKKENTLNWVRQITANIATQGIHSMILAIVLGIFSTLVGEGKTPTMYDQLFCLTAFACIIPFTSHVKQLLGIQGNMGAANGHAVAGMILGGAMLAKGTISSFKNRAGDISEGLSDLKNAKANEQLLNKSDSSDYGDIANTQKESVGSPTLSKDVIEGQKRQAKKKLATGIGGMALSGYGALGGLTGGLAFGPSGSFALGSVGSSIGNGVGSIGGNAGYSAISRGSHEIADKMYGKGIRPEFKPLTEGNNDYKWYQGYSKAKNMVSNLSYNVDQYKDTMSMTDEDIINTQNTMTGVDNDVLEGTKYQEQERYAKLQQAKYTKLGLHDKAFRAYAKHTPKKLDRESIDRTVASGNLDNTYLYSDKNMSILYNQSEEGEREILWTGSGNSNLTSPTISNVELGSEEITVPVANRQRINEQARVNVESTFGSYNPDNKEHSAHYKTQVDKMVNEELAQMRNIRTATGIKNINVKASVESYNPVDRVGFDEETIRRDINNNLRVVRESLQQQQKELENQVFVNETSIVCE